MVSLRARLNIRCSLLRFGLELTRLKRESHLIKLHASETSAQRLSYLSVRTDLGRSTLDSEFPLSPIAPRVTWCLVRSSFFFEHAGDLRIVILEVRHLQSSITDALSLHDVANLVAVEPVQSLARANGGKRCALKSLAAGATHALVLDAPKATAIFPL